MMNISGANNITSTSSNSITSLVTVNLVIWGIQIILYTSAIFCCLFLFFLLIRVQVFHRNLRILLGNMAIACIIQGISRDMWLLQVIFVTDSLYSSKNVLYCWLVIQTHHASLYAVGLSLISLAVERLRATIYAKTYENVLSIKLEVGLVAFQVSIQQNFALFLHILYH